MVGIQEGVIIHAEAAILAAKQSHRDKVEMETDIDISVIIYNLIILS